MNKLLLSISHLCEIFFIPKNKYEELPYEGKPNSYTLKISPYKKPIQLRLYGPDGDAYIDYDFTAHNDPEHHCFPQHKGAHKHIIKRRGSDFIRSKPLEMTNEEYNKYVKNYNQFEPLRIKVDFIK